MGEKEDGDRPSERVKREEKKDKEDLYIAAITMGFVLTGFGMLIAVSLYCIRLASC